MVARIAKKNALDACTRLRIRYARRVVRLGGWHAVDPGVSMKQDEQSGDAHLIQEGGATHWLIERHRRRSQAHEEYARHVRALRDVLFATRRRSRVELQRWLVTRAFERATAAGVVLSLAGPPWPLHGLVVRRGRRMVI